MHIMHDNSFVTIDSNVDLINKKKLWLFFPLKLRQKIYIFSFNQVKKIVPRVGINFITYNLHRMSDLANCILMN